MNENLFVMDDDIFTALGITEEWEDDEKEQYTVSYTHLTLPTILLV